MIDGKSWISRRSIDRKSYLRPHVIGISFWLVHRIRSRPKSLSRKFLHSNDNCINLFRMSRTMLGHDEQRSAERVYPSIGSFTRCAFVDFNSSSVVWDCHFFWALSSPFDYLKSLPQYSVISLAFLLYKTKKFARMSFIQTMYSVLRLLLIWRVAQSPSVTPSPCHTADFLYIWTSTRMLA